MQSLSIDFETRATVDLRKTGVYPYAEHPDTDIWCMAWAFGEEEPQIWTPDEPLPARIRMHIAEGGEIRAWNAAFERIIWNNIMVPRYGAPAVKLEQWVCSAAEAAAMSLPRSLDQAAAVTGVQHQKDQDGYALMLRMTRPRKIHDDGRIEWWTVPERLERLFNYCKQDVRVERAIVKVLRRLEPREREIYLLDQRINDTGIRIDRPLITAAQDIATEGLERANLVLCELTDQALTKITQVAHMKEWVNAKGIDTDSLDKAAIREMLESDLNPTVRSVLELRAEAGRSSLAKLKSFLDVACEDDKLRGLLLYHGANTGRWSGRLVQPHNFPRGDVDDVERFIPDVLAGRYDTIDLYNNPLAVVSSLLRAMMIADEGHDLIAADLSAIEARVVNWVAGQDDVLQLWRDGEDVYVHNAAALYQIALDDVKKFPHRQTGKFQELGCGFQMGWKKAVTAAKDVYGLVITEEQAKVIVKGYRERHPKVVQYWNDANDACINAVLERKTPKRFGAPGRQCTAIVAGQYLYIFLPSGRPLVYAAPRIVDRKTPWGELRPAVEFSGINSFTRRWERQALYGGLITENVVQAIARDVIAEGMLRVESRGYVPLLSVHDEIVAQVPAAFPEGALPHFEALISEVPSWAEGLPIAAEGWRSKRYRK